MQVVPPGEEWTRTSVTLPTKLMKALEERRKEVNEGRKGPDKLTRDRFFQLMLEWAEKELAAQRKKGK